MKAARHAPAAGAWKFTLSIATAVAVLAAFLLLLHR
jgi:hypothetical protein